MAVHIALGIGAGLVSALLFAAAGTGTVPAVLLMYFAPLPIIIVTLGWHHLVGLLALSSGAIVATILMQPNAGLAFALGPALAAWVFGYLALSRTPDLPADGTVGRARLWPEGWFPVGWLLVVLGLAGGVIAASSLVAMTSGDYAAYEKALRQIIAALMRREIRAGRPDIGLAAGSIGPDFVRFVVSMAPALLASMLTLILAVNAWLASKVVAISGRLVRPWPDIPSSRMPQAAFVIAMAAALLAQMAGFVGVAGMALSGGIGTAFALQGLAVIHSVSRRHSGRGLLLSATYLLTIVLAYLFLPLFALLGMADTAFPIRRALGGNGPPPLPPRPPFP